MIIKDNNFHKFQYDNAHACRIWLLLRVYVPLSRIKATIMGAPIGNQFWKLRSKHGRDLIFSSPTILWEACCEYFEATDSRKWIKTEFHGKDATECQVPNETPYTKSGLYLFLDIDQKTWEDYREKEGYSLICSRVELIIYTQKIEGASVGAFNHAIVARELGLVDKSEITKQKITVRRKE